MYIGYSQTVSYVEFRIFVHRLFNGRHKDIVHKVRLDQILNEFQTIPENIMQDDSERRWHDRGETGRMWIGADLKQLSSALMMVAPVLGSITPRGESLPTIAIESAAG